MSWLSDLEPGIILSLKLIIWSFVLTLMFAVPIGIGRVSRSRSIRWVSACYVELFRGIPLLALLTFVYFGLGRYVVHLHIDDFWLAVAAIGVGESAYLGEIYRGAIWSVPEAQWEVAASLRLSHRQTLWYAILPQAVLPAIPPTVNAMISTVKVSALASLIGVPELTSSAQNLVSETFQPMRVYLLLAGLYLVLTVPFSYASFALEGFVSRRLSTHMDAARSTAVDVTAQTAEARR
jgi:His/Glu/Gln/Arg/opine family amino acid ABC transporter permease subunit